jgi:hypothetical protein
VLGPLVLESLPLSYKGVQGGFEELWISGAGSAEESGNLGRHSQGVANPREGSKILTFPFRARVVCGSLLHLRSS